MAGDSVKSDPLVLASTDEGLTRYQLRLVYQVSWIVGVTIPWAGYLIYVDRSRYWIDSPGAWNYMVLLVAFLSTLIGTFIGLAIVWSSTSEHSLPSLISIDGDTLEITVGEKKIIHRIEHLRRIKIKRQSDRARITMMLDFGKEEVYRVHEPVNGEEAVQWAESIRGWRHPRVSIRNTLPVVECTWFPALVWLALCVAGYLLRG